MSKMTKLLLASLTVAGIAAPMAARSGVTETRSAIARPQSLAALVIGIAIHRLSVLAVLLLAQALGYSQRLCRK